MSHVQVVLSPQATRDLKKLDHKDVSRVLIKIEENTLLTKSFAQSQSTHRDFNWLVSIPHWELSSSFFGYSRQSNNYLYNTDYQTPQRCLPIEELLVATRLTPQPR